VETPGSIRKLLPNCPGDDPMAKTSAGLLLFRKRADQYEFLLVHLGGPFWAKKDAGAWFIPKGEVNSGEDQLDAARREFQEETGLVPGGTFLPLGSVKQKSGKTVVAWAFEGNFDPSNLRSNTFEMEWPPRSGKKRTFSEVDRAAFFPFESAREKMHPAEFELLSRLIQQLQSSN
jgi:predicted NUDIX family NTP pyrophosphohydrolase